MRCIEIYECTLTGNELAGINRNMRCIEIAGAFEGGTM